jgi:predicted N-acetyltransferase YhbS
MEIRQERPEDATAIGILTDAAFKNMPYSSHTEARIITALRSAGALPISLVADHNGEIVGHVAFSPVKINGVSGDFYGLGPISVTPDLQRRGIGTALIQDGLKRLESMHALICVVLGDPGYYRRFGFRSDTEVFYGDMPRGHFQCLFFKDSVPKGVVTYNSAFDVG